MQHEYKLKEKFYKANRYVCVRCNQSKIYSWIPGWPGWDEYYDKNFSKLEKENPCPGWDPDKPFPDTIVLGED